MLVNIDFPLFSWYCFITYLFSFAPWISCIWYSWTTYHAS